MPKNTGKGGKSFKRGAHAAIREKRELVLRETGTEYAKVLRMHGGGFLTAACFDGHDRLCHIPGKFIKKVWISAGDIILVSIREYQMDRGDVLLKYTMDEARELQKHGHIPPTSGVANSAASEALFEFTDTTDAAEEDGDSDAGESVDIDAL